MSRQLTGRVISDKNDKTIVISIASRKTHPIYKKQYTRNRKFMAHDEKNEAKTGDLVVISETRPLSARKRFILDKVIERSHIAFVETDAIADVPDEQPAAISSQPVVKKASKKLGARSAVLAADETKGSDK